MKIGSNFLHKTNTFSYDKNIKTIVHNAVIIAKKMKAQKSSKKEKNGERKETLEVRRRDTSSLRM